MVDDVCEMTSNKSCAGVNRKVKTRTNYLNITYRLFVCCLLLFVCLFRFLIGWLVGWLAGWLAAWLVGWLCFKL